MKYVIALAAALVLNASANLMIKFGIIKASTDGDLLSGGLAAALFKVITSPLLILGGVCFALNLLFYMYALQKMAISVAYPIMVTAGFAIIVIIAGWRLHERLSVVQWIGVAAMLIGVWLVASQATKQLGSGSPEANAEQIDPARAES